MPAEVKTISAQTQQNLVANGYLHSNPFNFRNAVAMGKIGTIFEREKVKNQAIEKINNLISYSENIEKQFYGEISNNTYDKIEDIQEMINKSTNYYEIFKDLNSTAFISEIENERELKIEELAREYLSNTDEYIDKKKMLEDLEEAILKEYNLTSNKKPVSLKNKNFRLYFESKIQNNPIDDAKQNTYLYNAMLKYLKARHVLDSDFLSAFKAAFQETTLDNTTQIAINNKSNIIGFIGEMSATLLFKEILRNLNHTDLKYEYIGDIPEKNGKKPPVDFLIDKYGFQVKNTLIESRFYGVKVQDYVSIDTFLDKTGEIMNKDELKYLLINVTYLQYFGRPYKLKMSDISNNILVYINSVLSGFADMLLTSELAEKTDGTYRNNFFFYKNKYLIPTSALLEGIRDSLKEEDNVSKSSIGYIGKNFGKKVYMSKIGEAGENSATIQKNKKNIVARLVGNGTLPTDEYVYEGELMEYGSQLGRDVSSTGTIRINYKLLNINLDKIEKIMRIK